MYTLMDMYAETDNIMSEVAAVAGVQVLLARW